MIDAVIFDLDGVILDTERYSERLPLVDGAPDAVKKMAAVWPLGLASSSNRELIDRALDVSGLAPYFRVTVSSEEVERGKPAPDVYHDVLTLAGVALASIKQLEPEILVGARRDSSRRARSGEHSRPAGRRARDR